MELINGIQQVGIGIQNVENGFSWYAQNLGADIQVFDDNNPAILMAPFMDGKANEKRAIMALNITGGGGYELWQFTKRQPRPPTYKIQWGDLGINCIEIKCRNLKHHHAFWKKKNPKFISSIQVDSLNSPHFYASDLHGNFIRFIQSDDFFGSGNLGGISGAIIGVSHMKDSLKFYKDTLGYDLVLFNKEGKFKGPSVFKQEENDFHRVRLARSKYSKSGFSRLLGNSYLELIQCLDRKPKKIFENRIWGDLGYIHLCFDTSNIEKVFVRLEEAGYPIKVKSQNDFDMGESKGHWGYVEDPDQTLIEFVETKSVPILPKLGWSLKIGTKYKEDPIPSWLIKALQFKRKKF